MSNDLCLLNPTNLTSHLPLLDLLDTKVQMLVFLRGNEQKVDDIEKNDVSKGLSKGEILSGKAKISYLKHVLLIHIKH